MYLLKPELAAVMNQTGTWEAIVIGEAAVLEGDLPGIFCRLCLV